MNTKIIALLIAVSVINSGTLDARGGGGHGGGGHGGGGRGGGFSGGGRGMSVGRGGAGFSGAGRGMAVRGSSRGSAGFSRAGRGMAVRGSSRGVAGIHGSRVAGYHGGYGRRGYGYRGRGFGRGFGYGLGAGYLGAWLLGAAWPYGGYWWNYIPDYWTEIPYYGVDYPIAIEIGDEDYWDFMNNTDYTIVVGNFDGTVRGKLSPGQSVKIPRHGDDRFVISTRQSKGQTFAGTDVQVSITNDMLD